MLAIRKTHSLGGMAAISRWSQRTTGKGIDRTHDPGRGRSKSVLKKLLAPLPGCCLLALHVPVVALALNHRLMAAKPPAWIATTQKNVIRVRWGLRCAATPGTRFQTLGGRLLRDSAKSDVPRFGSERFEQFDWCAVDVAVDVDDNFAVA